MNPGGIVIVSLATLAHAAQMPVSFNGQFAGPPEGKKKPDAKNKRKRKLARTARRRNR